MGGPMIELFAQIPGAATAADGQAGFGQYLMLGLILGSLYALIAIGYTMVYGIVELINFAHGDLFMLGSFLALSLATWVGVTVSANSTSAAVVMTLLLMLTVTPLVCAVLNVA